MRNFNQESYDYDLNRGTILKSPRFNKFTLPNSTIGKDLKISIVDYVKNFEKHFDLGIGIYLFSATPGSGKTTILSIILKELMKKGYRVYCDSFIEIKNSLKSEFKQENQTFLQTLKDKDIVAIDDIGSEVMSNWLEEIFKELLDYRYNLLKPTFFTSNRQIASLPFADKSKDRLREISLVLEFPEKSLRKEPKK
jgi:DNA replication protein DnaC